MSITPGERIGPYEVTSSLGEGGMGVVYRARDTQLQRQVALKLLPDHFADDPDRLNRFEREAQVLASLNHPNIAQIYGLEKAGTANCIVMELVEGDTLQERLKRGPIPLDEALQIAKQVVDALEAAHERGIVHRDLKPGNIKRTPSGTVKILDFGLAKASRNALPSQPGFSNSPTLMSGSMAGAVLGTAPYMSPEQARGKDVDARTDVWAFGCVLYELLTGKQIFAGETTTDILAKVLEGEPKWDALPTGTPSSIRILLEAALNKDTKQRLQHIGDTRIFLNRPSILDRSVPVVVGDRSARRGWFAAAVLLAAVVLLGLLYFRPKPLAPLESTRFEIAQPANAFYTDNFAISPDGRKLAFIAAAAGVSRLWVRSMDSVEPRPLSGTEGATGTPFWSPDSRYVAFFAQGKLQKIEGAGSPAQTLCSTAVVQGGFWTRDNRIVFATASFGNFSGSGLFQVSAAGGAVSPLTKLAPGESGHSFPTLLPDGDHFLYTGAQGAPPETGGIYLGSLNAKPDQQATRKLLPDASKTAYSPFIGAGAGSADGYVLFVRGSALMAQPWDSQRLELTGEAAPIAERVPSTGLSTSATGVLVYRMSTAAAGDQLTWFDRQGKALGTAGEPSAFEVNSPPALSPDGTRVAFARTDPQSGNTDIWLFEFARGVGTRFTSDPGAHLNPVWSPDGSHIAFAAQRTGVWGIYQKASNDLTGSGELLYKSGNQPARPSSWSRDGRFLLYSAGSPYDIWMLGLNAGATPRSADRSPQPLVHGQFNERGARFSPDGRFFAYVSNLSGSDENYVQTFDPSASGNQPSEGVKISKDGGNAVRWRGDGKEIFYRSPSGDLMSVDISTTPVFRPGTPRLLFKTPPAPAISQLLFWDVTSDGQRFLFAISVGQSSAAPYTVLQNWQALLKR